MEKETNDDRNLTSKEKLRLVSEMHAEEAAKAVERQGGSSVSTKDAGKTCEIIAKKLNLGSRTVERIWRILSKGSPKLIKQVEDGELSIMAAATQITAPKEEAVVEDEGNYYVEGTMVYEDIGDPVQRLVGLQVDHGSAKLVARALNHQDEIQLVLDEGKLEEALNCLYTDFNMAMDGTVEFDDQNSEASLGMVCKVHEILKHLGVLPSDAELEDNRE